MNDENTPTQPTVPPPSEPTPEAPVDPGFGVEAPPYDPEVGLLPGHGTDEVNRPSTLPDFNPSGSNVVAEIKERTENLLNYIHENVPANRERAIAITNYEQAAMWAVKANFTSQPK